MKKLYYLSLLIIIGFFSGFKSGSNFETSTFISNFSLSLQHNPVPDVMGHINILEPGGTSKVFSITESDSFPVFPGFPKSVPGSTIEGGIVCNMDSDPEFEIVYNIGFTIQAWNFDVSFRLAADCFLISSRRGTIVWRYRW
jgi:hypothetical protein